MEDYIDNFISYLKKDKKLSENSVASYKRDITAFYKYVDKNNKTLSISDVNDLSSTHINGYLLTLEKSKKSSSTISRSIASLKSYFYFLLREKIILDNPAEHLTPPKVIRALPDVLTKEQVKKFLELPDLSTPKGIRDKAMLEVLYATGIKASEIVLLKINDVNLTLNYVKCVSGDKIRIIPIGNPANNAISLYLNESRDVFVKGNDCNYFFVNTNGRVMTRQGFWKIVKEYAADVDFGEKITPNIFRHSFAAHMVENGADLKSVQEMMGHCDISTTQLYLQMYQSHLNDVYRKSHPRA